MSKIQNAIRVLILAGLFALAPAGNLHAGQEPKKQPYAYLYPKELKTLTRHLQREDVEVRELREDIELDVQVPRITEVTGSEETVRLKTESRQETRRFRAGTVLVKANQESSNAVKTLLEATSEKQKEVRRLFGRLEKGDDYPVIRLKEYVPITQGPVPPLKKKREFNKPITFEALYEAKKKINFSGSPVSGLTWLDDGEHYLQVRDSRFYKVHAVSGRSELLFEPNDLATGLKSLPTTDEETAESLSKRRSLNMNPSRSAVLFDYENDLYYCTLDGKTAVRLTSTPGREQYGTFSPNGEFVAFVRDKNLYVVDIATQTERALTTDGGGTISNGEADWVYYEEVYGRRWKAFSWSPDSSAIALMQFDDAPVHEFTVVNNTTKKQDVEQTRYPRAGEPNPKARVGTVSAAGGRARWADLDTYLDGTYLITRIGWTPDSKRIFFFVQDRTQTWLDFDTAPKQGGQATRLFRETTKAWVDVPDEPEFLSDGSFLFFSERTGWKHLYLYDRDGKLKHAVTKGKWEARQLRHVDEKNGWVYFTGTRDSHIAENLYRADLSGGKIKRLTRARGTHRVNISPNGRYFIDTWSSNSRPTKVALFGTNRRRLRMLDTNPVYERREYQFGEYEQFQIETKDGFLLEASLLKPPDFDASRKYPVWFMTYGGPHAPTIRDTWGGGRAYDQMLAQMGMLVFRCDPRSASGKGACSAWTAYKQLGVQELKDIEEAIEWLKSKPYVDGDRIGMSGHSYGGFMTAYALTHSKLFAGGIAGAPVTDWHLYDTIYTERYMDVPQNNVEGYEKTSVIEAAKDLHGRLLILHGAIDDNVHVENTYKFIQALQQADKQFELMIYPTSRHGVGGMHYRRMTVDFIRSVLKLTDHCNGESSKENIE
ncbi:MAG: DPP IV N-terminal domain-containing protein [Sedimentisphaerales bacterium]